MKRTFKNIIFMIFVLSGMLFSSFLFAESYPAFDNKGGGLILPNISIGMNSTAKTPTEVAGVVKILLMLTILSLAPAILITMTSFTRIVVVLSFLRQAIGVQTMPPNQIIIGLSLFLTFFIMAPTFETINKEVVTPYMDNKLDQGAALTKLETSVRKFMFAQTRPKDLALFIKISKSKKPNNRDEVGTHILIPAFLISELKTAFQIGFMIYLPFLIIDMIVSSILMAMGMMMLPPVMISLPFKLLLFVLVDGWALIVGALVKSFN